MLTAILVYSHAHLLVDKSITEPAGSLLLHVTDLESVIFFKKRKEKKTMLYACIARKWADAWADA